MKQNNVSRIKNAAIYRITYLFLIKQLRAISFVSFISCSCSCGKTNIHYFPLPINLDLSSSRSSNPLRFLNRQSWIIIAQKQSSVKRWTAIRKFPI